MFVPTRDVRYTTTEERGGELVSERKRVHSFGLSMTSSQDAVSPQQLLRKLADVLDGMAEGEVDTIILTTEDGPHGKRPAASVFFAGSSSAEPHSHGEDILLRELIPSGEQSVRSLLRSVETARQQVKRQAPRSPGVQSCCVLIDEHSTPDDEVIRVSTWISE